MIEGVTEETHGSDRVPDLKPITSEPWLAWQNLQRERNGALFEVHGLVRFKVLDTADIVRDAIFHQASYCDAPNWFSLIDLPYLQS